MSYLINLNKQYNEIMLLEEKLELKREQYRLEKNKQKNYLKLKNRLEEDLFYLIKISDIETYMEKISYNFSNGLTNKMYKKIKNEIILQIQKENKEISEILNGKISEKYLIPEIYSYLNIPIKKYIKKYYSGEYSELIYKIFIFNKEKNILLFIKELKQKNIEYIRKFMKYIIEYFYKTQEKWQNIILLVNDLLSSKCFDDIPKYIKKKYNTEHNKIIQKKYNKTMYSIIKLNYIYDSL